jgi:hypothetical protein
MTSRVKWELTWKERPSEEANNLNPAFCGELIFRTIREFHRTHQRPLALPLTFLVLPIALHAPTRGRLPGNVSAMFGAWVAEQGPYLADLPDRVARLVPVSREGLLFLIQHKAVAIDDGGVVPGDAPLRIGAKLDKITEDTADARRAAALIGRGFARQGQPALIMQALGVSP